MKILLSIAVMGRLHETKPAWGTLLNTVAGPIDLMVIENTGKEEERNRLQNFFDNYVTPRWPGHVSLHYMPDNIGVIRSMQYTYEKSDHDVLAFLHNDVFVYDTEWDRLVVHLFKEESAAGLVGFFGAEGLHPNTGRFGVWNNMIEAEIHGQRLTDEIKEVAVLDGLSMFASRKMLDVRGGVDTSFDTHHFYDLDLSLESLDRGFKNYVIPTNIHHQSGITACGPDFQEWAATNRGSESAIYDKNKQHFIDKWAPRLPYKVGVGWNE